MTWLGRIGKIAKNAPLIASAVGNLWHKAKHLFHHAKHFAQKHVDNAHDSMDWAKHAIHDTKAHAKNWMNRTTDDIKGTVQHSIDEGRKTIGGMKRSLLANPDVQRFSRFGNEMKNTPPEKRLRTMIPPIQKQIPTSEKVMAQPIELPHSLPPSKTVPQRPQGLN